MLASQSSSSFNFLTYFHRSLLKKNLMRMTSDKTKSTVIKWLVSDEVTSKRVSKFRDKIKFLIRMYERENRAKEEKK